MNVFIPSTNLNVTVNIGLLDKQPLEQTVQCLTVAKVLSIGSTACKRFQYSVGKLKKKKMSSGLQSLARRAAALGYNSSLKPRRLKSPLSGLRHPDILQRTLDCNETDPSAFEDARLRRQFAEFLQHLSDRWERISGRSTRTCWTNFCGQQTEESADGTRSER